MTLFFQINLPLFCNTRTASVKTTSILVFCAKAKHFALALQYLSADSLQQSSRLLLSGLVILPLCEPHLRQTERQGIKDEGKLRDRRWRRGGSCLRRDWDKKSSQVGEARDFCQQGTKWYVLCQKVKDFEHGGNVCSVFLYFYSWPAQVKIQDWMAHLH